MLERPSALAGRQGRLSLLFESDLRGRTFIRDQFSSYPFHICRPFHLDGGANAGMATLYLQSCSGGLYSGDSLAMEIRTRTGAQAHLTTQASTIVHQCRSGPAEVTAEIHVANGSYFEFFPDPYILFTGAELVSRTRVHVEDNAGLVIFDGFLSHDHRNDGGPFGRIASEISVLDSGGLPIAIDRYEVTGEQLSRQRVGEMQDYGEQGGLLAILAGIDLEDLIRDLRSIARDFRDVMVGISRLSGDRGISARLIGRNNIGVKRCKQEIWKAVRSARYGLSPPIRAK